MRGNPWIFAILFLGGTLYFGIKYNFELTTRFTSDTAYTKAVIVDFETVPARNGSRGYQQRIEFAFKVDEEVFISRKKISARHGMRPIGSKLELKYQVDSPLVNSIETYYKPTFFEKERKYFWSNQEYGYDKIALKNGILKLEQYGKKGKLISRRFYQANIKESRLIASDLFDHDNSKVEFNIEKDGLLETKTNKKYKNSAQH